MVGIIAGTRQEVFVLKAREEKEEKNSKAGNFSLSRDDSNPQL